MSRAGVARSLPRTRVPAGGGLVAARWRRQGSVQDTLWEMSPTLICSVRLAEASWAGVGAGRNFQSLKYPPFWDPGEGPDHSNPRILSPRPLARPDLPLSCLLHLAGGESLSFSRFILKDASKSKQSRCLIEKIRNYGKMWHLAAIPCPSFASPSPALLSMPTWYSSHCLTQEKVGTAFREGGNLGSARSSQRLCLPGPSGAPAPAAPGETTGGRAAPFSGSVSLKGQHCQGLLSGGAPHRHPKSQAGSVSSGGSSAAPRSLGSSGQEAPALGPQQLH